MSNSWNWILPQQFPWLMATIEEFEAALGRHVDSNPVAAHIDWGFPGFILSFTMRMLLCYLQYIMARVLTQISVCRWKMSPWHLTTFDHSSCFGRKCKLNNIAEFYFSVKKIKENTHNRTKTMKITIIGNAKSVASHIYMQK